MFTANIGLIGLGTVGGGVIEILEKQRVFFREHFGMDIRLAAVAERDETKTKNLPDNIHITKEAKEIIGNPEIQIVIELVGGITAAKDIVMESIAAGKHVVTANKHLLAKFSKEIFPAAEKTEVDVYFEASVGGGIPIIKALRESLVANDIQKIQCIINGTTNYILTRIKSEKKPFDKILTDAQEKGFAEADPTFDVDGIDAAHKVVIMANLAYGCWVNLDDIYIEGIRNITPEDVSYADDLGYTIKLLGIIQKRDDKIDVRVHPTMLPHDHILANVNGVYNGVALKGDAIGSVLLTGKGAGRYPTASAVVSDVIDVCRNMAAKARMRIPMSFFSPESRKSVVPIEEIESRFYLRFTVVDEPGVLANLTAQLGRKQVGIASVVQEERAPKDNVPVVILTHHAKEQALREAINEIDKMDVVKKPTQVIRIEEEKVD